MSARRFCSGVRLRGRRRKKRVSKRAKVITLKVAVLAVDLLVDRQRSDSACRLWFLAVANSRR
jgi:hypothetical protein